jgi:hypothetical protein
MKAAVALLAFVAVSCSVAGVPSRAGADALWLPEGAAIQGDGAYPVVVINGRSIYRDDTAAVGFTLDGRPDDVAQTLDAHFASRGWQRRMTQQLNPHLATSFDRGFTNAGGGIIPPGPLDPRPHRRWHGEWQSRGGEIVTYVLSAQGDHIRGYASYAPRRVVERQRQEVR